jgi:hypothetical protein
MIHGILFPLYGDCRDKIQALDWTVQYISKIIERGFNKI